MRHDLSTASSTIFDLLATLIPQSYLRAEVLRLTWPTMVFTSPEHSPTCERSASTVSPGILYPDPKSDPNADANNFEES